MYPIFSKTMWIIRITFLNRTAFSLSVGYGPNKLNKLKICLGETSARLLLPEVDVDLPPTCCALIGELKVVWCNCSLYHGEIFNRKWNSNEQLPPYCRANLLPCGSCCISSVCVCVCECLTPSQDGVRSWCTLYVEWSFCLQWCVCQYKATKWLLLIYIGIATTVLKRLGLASWKDNLFFFFLLSEIREKVSYICCNNCAWVIL